MKRVTAELQLTGSRAGRSGRGWRQGDAAGRGKGPAAGLGDATTFPSDPQVRTPAPRGQAPPLPQAVRGDGHTPHALLVPPAPPPLRWAPTAQAGAWGALLGNSVIHRLPQLEASTKAPILAGHPTARCAAPPQGFNAASSKGSCSPSIRGHSRGTPTRKTKPDGEAWGTGGRPQFSGRQGAAGSGCWGRRSLRGERLQISNHEREDRLSSRRGKPSGNQQSRGGGDARERSTLQVPAGGQASKNREQRPGGRTSFPRTDPRGVS